MGKSEVLRELQSRGLEAHGVDEDGFGDWVNRKSGQAEELTPEINDIHEWFTNHAWVLNKGRISELAAKSDSLQKNIFLCGTADGFDDCKNLFAKVIALHMSDPDLLASRIQQRTDVDFGKDPAELERILQWQQTGEAHFRSLGATILNADRPPDEIVDELLTLI